MSRLELLEHPSSGYAQRTAENAGGADVTLAFAMDFSTAGERLTKREAGRRLVPVDLRWDPLQSARYVFSQLRARQAHTLNIAGNGMYTLHKHGWTEFALDERLFYILRLCHTHWPITGIRSGGQTGADEAGLVAAVALQIPATGLYPMGFRQRGASGVDVNMSADELILRINGRASRLLQNHLV